MIALPAWVPFSGNQNTASGQSSSQIQANPFANIATLQPPMGEVDQLLNEINQASGYMNAWATQMEQQMKLQDDYMFQKFMGGMATGGEASFDANPQFMNALSANLTQSVGLNEQDMAFLNQLQGNMPSPSGASDASSAFGANGTINAPSSSNQSKAATETTQETIHNHDHSSSGGSMELESLGQGDHKLNKPAAEQFKKATAEFKVKYGMDIPLVSSYRSPEHNKKIGGAPNSKHTHGNALDVDWVGLNSKGFTKEAVDVLRQFGFEPLDGVTYVKNGTPQGEHNHFDFVGVGKTESNWKGPKLA